MPGDDEAERAGADLGVTAPATCDPNGADGNAVAQAAGFDQEISGVEMAIAKRVVLDLADRPELVRIADRIRGQLRKTTDGIAAIGRDLKTAKRMLLHGEFEPWMDREFGMSHRTASHYMRIAQLVASDKAALFLPLGVARLLAAPSTPESVRSETLAKAKVGVNMTAARIKTSILQVRGKGKIAAIAKGRCPKCGYKLSLTGLQCQSK